MDELLKRLEDLEVRYAFQQDHLRQLDDVLREQAERIELLTRELAAVREQLAEDGGEEVPLLEQVPPHY